MPHGTSSSSRRVTRRDLLRATGLLGASFIWPGGPRTGDELRASGAARPVQDRALDVPKGRGTAPIVPAPSIVPFDEWADAACPRPTGAGAAPLRRLVVHHTHEPVARTPDEVLRALHLTCKAHTDRGFDTIGYHYVVDPWGGVWQGRGGLPADDGRPPATHPEGAHVAGSNPSAVGVVFLGDHETQPPTRAALTTGTQLLAWLLQDTGIDPDAEVPTRSTGVGTARFTGIFHPRAVTGHAASNQTACPGHALQQLLGEIRHRMRQWLAGEEPSGWDGLTGTS